MAGLQGGNRAPGNGRIAGGKAGVEHRFSRPAVDTDRHDEARVGSIDRDGRWGGQVGPIQKTAGTMDGGRGTLMGAKCDADGSSGFKR